MQTLKKLILKEWLSSFITSAIALLLLITIATLISGFLRSSVTPGEVIINFILDLPNWLNKILPVSCLTATLFSVNNLIRKSELVAIFAAGFSTKDFIILIIQIATIVALIQLINVSILDPISKKLRHQYLPSSLKKFRHDKNMGLRTSSIDSGKIWYKSENYFFSYQAYKHATKELKNIDVYYFNSSYRLQTKLSAKTAINIKDNIWKFIDGSKYFSLSNTTFPQFELFDEIEVKLNEISDDFKDINSDIKTMGLIGLSKFIFKLKTSGINTSEYEIILYDKIVSSIICLLFALIPIGGIFNPNRRHSSFGKNVLFTFIFAILFWLIYTSCIALGENDKVPAFMAAFTIPVILMGYIFYQLKRRYNLL